MTNEEYNFGYRTGSRTRSFFSTLSLSTNAFRSSHTMSASNSKQPTKEQEPDVDFDDDLLDGKCLVCDRPSGGIAHQTF